MFGWCFNSSDCCEVTWLDIKEKNVFLGDSESSGVYSESLTVSLSVFLSVFLSVCGSGCHPFLQNIFVFCSYNSFSLPRPQSLSFSVFPMQNPAVRFHYRNSLFVATHITLSASCLLMWSDWIWMIFHLNTIQREFCSISLQF